VWPDCAGSLQIRVRRLCEHELVDFVKDKPHSSQQFSSFFPVCALLQIPRHSVEPLSERFELPVVCHEVAIHTMN